MVKYSCNAFVVSQWWTEDWLGTMNNFTNYRVFGICGDSALAFVQHSNRRSVYWCSVHNTFTRGHFLEGLSETIIVSMSFLTSSDEPGGGQTNKVMAFGCESREFKSSYRQVNVPVWEPCVVLGPFAKNAVDYRFVNERNERWKSLRPSHLIQFGAASQ